MVTRRSVARCQESDAGGAGGGGDKGVAVAVVDHPQRPSQYYGRIHQRTALHLQG